MDNNTRYMLSDMLESNGFRSLAHDVKFQSDGNIIDRYVRLIENKARKINDVDILDRLSFAGLIY